MISQMHFFQAFAPIVRVNFVCVKGLLRKSSYFDKHSRSMISISNVATYINAFVFKMLVWY